MNEDNTDIPPPSGFNAATFQSYDNNGNRIVGVISFSGEMLDNVEDRIYERIHQKLEFRDILEEMVEDQSTKAVWEWGARFIAFIFQWKKPSLALDQLAWLFGVRSREGMSVSELAGKHSVSKQAFQQGAKRIASKLGMEKLSHLRSDEAKANMRKSHYSQ